MKIEALTRVCFGWCPGYENASRFIPDRDVNGRAIGVAYLILVLVIIFSPAFNGIFRFILMVFTSFIGAPAVYTIFRLEQAGDQEHSYPDQAEHPTPSEQFGEFNINRPLAEAPVFGPSRSSAGYFTDMTIEREWLHPDILKLRELQEERRKKAKEKSEK